MRYIEPLFRPPSEGASLILQVTNGCSWNQCAFCEMYTAPQKKFSVKPFAQIETELEEAAVRYAGVRRIFLADGDAMVLSMRRLLQILEAIQKYFPNLNRVSSYCLPRNVASKSTEELEALRNAGLSLVYVGAESGDDELLNIINKGETFASTASALNKLHQAGIKSSVMILNGLGGQALSQQHALNSARLVNETQPHYLATLVVSFPLGEQRFRTHFPSGIDLLDQRGLFQELEQFISHTELENTIFRSDHASNYLALKGVLGKDKQRLLGMLHTAQHAPEKLALRQEWQRGL